MFRLTNDHHATLKTMAFEQLRRIPSAEVPKTFPRIHGSPFWITKIPDLRGVKHRPCWTKTSGL